MPPHWLSTFSNISSGFLKGRAPGQQKASLPLPLQWYYTCYPQTNKVTKNLNALSIPPTSCS
uniref:Macaca fascicularis brain cDNA, clone: QflA-16018 n=1 Tax=Macaca fascicularis TaxID=9541 RepID=I7GB75_MACFA|nr:unnamed protein product [Macaca fascicularis]